MRRVLLNIDVGELAGESEELYAAAHVAHIACGGHAGDDASMKLALELCAMHGATAGAHPSYADREASGRGAQAFAPQEVRALVEAQCARLAEVTRAAGRGAIASMKPHGALYHDAGADPAIARAVVLGAVAALGTVRVVGPPRGALANAAAAAGVPFDGEAFADRGVRPDGTLVPPGELGALLLDPAACGVRAAELARDPSIATVCVHGDSPGAVAIARAVRAALDAVERG